MASDEFKKDVSPNSTSTKKKVTKKMSAKMKNEADEHELKLSEQEKHHLKFGHGKRGVRVDTQLGGAYFSLDDESILVIGNKININPLTLYSLSRWSLSKDKSSSEFSLRSKLVQGTRIFLAPSEDWEFDYIREDELKAITKICEKMTKAATELNLEESDIRNLKKKVGELTKSNDKEVEEHFFVALPFYRVAKSLMYKESVSKENLEQAEKNFLQMWEAAGFLDPERNAETVRNREEQKKAFQDLIDWKAGISREEAD